MFFSVFVCFSLFSLFKLFIKQVVKYTMKSALNAAQKCKPENIRLLPWIGFQTFDFLVATVLTTHRMSKQDARIIMPSA